jgi:hypothetical protein
MNTAEAFLQDIERSIKQVEQQANSQPRKGMMVYLDKSTPIMVQYASEDSFNKAKAVSSRKGQQSCLRNVIDNGGRKQ